MEQPAPGAETKREKRDIRTVAVFCGSRFGADRVYRGATAALGRALGEAGIGLVYGGGQIGLMGVLANAVIGAGGRVVGVIPDFLVKKEAAHPGVSGLIVTHDMHSRKQRMFDLADAFVTMPGGIGTLDETVEVVTWRTLGLHKKPILVCDVEGSAGPFVAFIESAIAEGFAEPALRDAFEVIEGVAAVVARLQAGAAAKRSSQWTL